MITTEDITLLLRRVDDDQPDAMDELMRVVYDDLERMAASHLQRAFGPRARQVTLEPAALVNESFLRLIKQRKHFDNRGQFFAIATKLMLQVLIDYRRQKLAAKRGGAAGAASDARMTLMLDDERVAAPETRSALVEVEDLAAALDRLEAIDARKADIVKMRVVWSMTVPEIAAALEVSPSSVDRDWKFAKAWIADEVGLTTL
jgi:RNA polymerase sigma factor (TIGR02999 family)